MPRKRKVTSSKATSSKKQKPIEESKILSDSAEADSTTAAATSPVKSASSSPTNSNRKEVVAVVDEEADSVTEPTRHKQTDDDDDDEASEARFLGEPLPDAEARQRWPKRYEDKKGKKVAASRNSKEKDDSDEIIQARCHYTRAEVDGYVYDLYDDAYVKGEDGEDNFIGRIIEMFESVDGTLYFTAQWFYRARDTVINKLDHLIDNKRVFFSEIRDDNPLECLVEKLNIVRVQLNADLDAKKATIPPCDYFYDTLYLLPYSSFVNLPPECKRVDSGTSSTISSDVEANGTSGVKFYDGEVSQVREHHKSKLTLLDLYSGCGAMSTGLCLGANMSGVYLETRWAVDLNTYACESLRLNHPETEVRNESVEDFLLLLKEWEKLCKTFSLVKSSDPQEPYYSFDLEDDEGDNEDEDDNNDDAEVFEVEKILGICYGVPKEKGKRGLHFKVRWKNYGEDEDTWEPVEGLGNCRERIREFIMDGYKSKILPLTGDVDVICGGPPCQGVSGFNRFRNKANPLNDEKNKQLVVFMEVVEFLQPRFVLMENVVDLVKFAHGFLGRYALGRLVQMNYQVRMGLMAAGAYGLPQFRMRCFLWGARPTEKLPQYPLPTHDVVVRGVIPLQFEINTVAYDEGHTRPLEKKLLLEDAISDLPPVENNEHRDELPYDRDPKTQFQRFIRLRKDEMSSFPSKLKPTKQMLYDHRPLQLNKDDYERVCSIPKNKGANFRDLPGVRVRPDNKVEWDPNVERVLLKSGKPLVPDYAMSFVQGSSSKPFARLWWDETVPTVVTRAEPHNQAILHPVQDRVLSVRENARLQGFPDYYKLCGPIKERYIQVGNAVAVPVARALGYALGLAFQGTAGDDPLFTLPSGFPNVLEQLYSASSEDGARL